MGRERQETDKWTDRHTQDREGMVSERERGTRGTKRERRRGEKARREGEGKRERRGKRRGEKRRAEMRPRKQTLRRGARLAEESRLEEKGGKGQEDRSGVGGGSPGQRPSPTWVRPVLVASAEPWLMV